MGYIYPDIILQERRLCPSAEQFELKMYNVSNNSKGDYLMNKKLLTLFLAFAFALAACGGGSGPSTTINVQLTEFVFTPDSFSVPAGQEITLNADNNGAVVHQFIIMKLGTSVGEDFGPEDEANIYWKTEIQPGEKVSVTFTAPTEPGEYQVVCGTQGHYAAGMVGKLIVVADK